MLEIIQRFYYGAYKAGKCGITIKLGKPEDITWEVIKQSKHLYPSLEKIMRVTGQNLNGAINTYILGDVEHYRLHHNYSLLEKANPGIMNDELKQALINCMVIPVNNGLYHHGYLVKSMSGEELEEYKIILEKQTMELGHIEILRTILDPSELSKHLSPELSEQPFPE